VFHASSGSCGDMRYAWRMRVSARRNRSGCTRSNGGITERASSRLHGSTGHKGSRRDNRSLGLPLRQWNDRHRCELWAIRRFGRQHQSILQCEHRFWERPGFSGELLWADRRLIDWGRTVRIRGRWMCDAALAKIDRIRRLVELGLKAKAK